jgi:hypothetical protein
MTDHTAIEAATKRLQQALDQLDVALELRLEASARDATLADRLHTLDADRSRLAAELDGAVARAKRLDSTNREIASRIDATMDTIRSVIATQKRAV